MPDAFDARFSALRRHYRYRVATAPHGAEPLRARDTLAWPHPLDVGRGRRAPDWPSALLARRERASEVPVAPAHGLTLVGVDYPAPEDLAARASVTRRLRTAPDREDREARVSPT